MQKPADWKIIILLSKHFLMVEKISFEPKTFSLNFGNLFDHTWQKYCKLIPARTFTSNSVLFASTLQNFMRSHGNRLEVVKSIIKMTNFFINLYLPQKGQPHQRQFNKKIKSNCYALTGMSDSLWTKSPTVSNLLPHLASFTIARSILVPSESPFLSIVT